MFTVPVLAPVGILLAGAVLVFLLGRIKRTPRVVALLAIGCAIGLQAWLLFTAQSPTQTIGWIPGSPEVSLEVTARFDLLSAAFCLLMNGITFAGVLGTLGDARPSRAQAAGIVALAAANMVVLAASAAIAAVALLALTLALGLRSLGDPADKATVESAAGPLLAGIALLGAATLGTGSTVGFLILLGATLALCGQYPLTWFSSAALGGRTSTSLLHLVTLVGVGGYLAIRWVLPSTPVWGLQAIGMSGAVTTVTAGILALRTQRVDRTLSYLAAGQIGYFLLALGEGNVTAIAAGLLHFLSVLPALGGLVLLAGRIERQTGSSEIASLAGIAQRLPTFAALTAVLAAMIGAAPFLNGSYLAKLVLFSTALNDGRFLFALFAYGGAALGAVGAARLAMPLFARTEDPTELLRGGGRMASLGAGLLCATGIGLGALAWTGYDPASRAIVSALNVTRLRPVAGELFAISPIATGIAALLLFLAVAVGVLVAFRLFRETGASEGVGASSQTQESTMLARIEPEGRLVVASRIPLLATAGPEPAFVSAAIDPRPVELAIWHFFQGLTRFVVAGLSALEGRYYVAAILISGLWIAIVFMGS